MTKKNNRVQVFLSDDDARWIETYKKENNIASMSKAVGELIEFAIRIKSRAKEDETVSNRELLEEILKANYRQEAIIKRNYLNVYDDNKAHDKKLVDRVKDKINDFFTIANAKATAFINNESDK